MKTPTQNQIDALKRVVNKLYDLSTEVMKISIELYDGDDSDNPAMSIHDEIDAIGFSLADMIASAN